MSVRFRFSLQRGKVGVVCAFLVFAASCLPCGAAGADRSPSAIFLVARGALTDPFFAHSVVLVMNNLAPAPLGIIINRPTSLPVARLFPDVGRLRYAQAKVYFGGPVDFQSVWFLFRARTPPGRAVEVLNGVYLSADGSLLRHLLARTRPMAGLRIFAGHAGWAPGQLQAEIRAGYWTLRRADAGSIFGHASDYPWPAPRVPRHGSLRAAAWRASEHSGAGLAGTRRGALSRAARLPRGASAPVDRIAIAPRSRP